MQADILTIRSNQRMRHSQLYPCYGLAQAFIPDCIADSSSRCLQNLRFLGSTAKALEVLEVTVGNAGYTAARENANFETTIYTSWREFCARSLKIRKSSGDNRVRADCYSNLRRSLGVAISSSGDARSTLPRI